MASPEMTSAVAEVESWLAPRDPLARRLATPDLASVREFVQVLDRCVVRLNTAAGVPRERASVLWQAVIQGSFLVFLAYRQRLERLPSELLLKEWTHAGGLIGALPPGEKLGVPLQRVASAPSLVADEDLELAALFNTALSTELHERLQGDTESRDALRRLAAQLGLSYDQLGRMFQVSGETARRWEKGETSVPQKRRAEISHATAALDRLLAMFKPERLSQVVRRPAPAFEQRPALEWILRGRIADVADRYDLALSYQA
jgi:hypothetical protein